mgnify:CR=1 FL=1
MAEGRPRVQIPARPFMARERELILKWALQNAIRFGGRASEGAVLSKVLGEKPELKASKAALAALKREVAKIVKKLRKKSIEQQKEMLRELAPELLAPTPVAKKELPPLKETERGVVMRFEPSASGPLHIGHAYVLGLNHSYCARYGGRLILRIADTNPENIDPIAYRAIPEDAAWLTEGRIAETVVQSDRAKLYYSYAERLLDKGKAYVCSCSQEIFKADYADQLKACPHRDLSREEQLALYRKMFTEELREGQAVLRIKTEMGHPNPALRDWVALRINDAEHPRHGHAYRVWPTMNFAVAVDDIEQGVTHTIRGKDHIDNAKKQSWIFRALGAREPQNFFLGRINFIGLDLSCTKTKAAIKGGLFSGWQDIRLPFLAPLKRRGYLPGAFLRFATEMAISQVDKTITAEEYFKLLNAFNKELVEPIARRFFFVPEPKEIVIEGAPERTVELEFHPDKPSAKKRVFETKGRFYIAAKDLEVLKAGKLYRLMDCLNFRKRGSRFVFDSLDYAAFKEVGEKIIHWLPAQPSLCQAELLMPDASTQRGLCEPAAASVEVGELCQFERIGFVRCDSKSKEKLSFWYGHR